MRKSNSSNPPSAKASGAISYAEAAALARSGPKPYPVINHDERIKQYRVLVVRAGNDLKRNLENLGRLEADILKGLIDALKKEFKLDDENTGGNPDYKRVMFKLDPHPILPVKSELELSKKEFLQKVETLKAQSSGMYELSLVRALQALCTYI